MSPLPDIAHWWAIEAMIASYNHVYKVVYGTTYKTLDAIGVSNYGAAPIAPFQFEFLALDDDPEKVAQSIRDYQRDGGKYVLDVFHDARFIPELKAHYDQLGYNFIRSGSIYGLKLPAPVRGDISFIKRVESLEEAEFANQSLREEDEVIHPQTLNDPQIHNFYAEMDGRAIGWVQLVTVYPGTGYVNQLCTLSRYRGRGVGTALMERLHSECDRLNLGQIVLVSSEIAIGLYHRLGYRPLAYFTAFTPKEAGDDNAS